MTDSLPLADRVVVVTGASSGIGRAIALAMARAGGDVALTYRANEDGAREVEREIKAGDLVFIPPGVPHGIKQSKSITYLNIRFEAREKE